MKLPVSRRDFLQTTALGAAAVSVLPKPLFAAEAGGRLKVGFIGTGNQGMGLIKRVLRFDLADIVAVCDVNEGSHGYRDPGHFYGREPAKKMVEDHGKRHKGKAAHECKAYADFRDLLADPQIDAVFAIVPDHWHAPVSILAAKAGKHVYCEKPLTLTVAEGREIMAAVDEAGVVFQVGSQERSNPVSQFVCNSVKNGAIGDVTRIETVVGYNNKVGPGPGWSADPVPKEFDYKMWLGPAPQVPYHHDRCLYRFRFNYDYSGGQITNFGAHSNDMAHWGMGMDTSGPTEIQCNHAEFLPEGSLFNTATVTSYRCKYPNGVELVCKSSEEKVQTRFEGSNGWMQTGYAGTTASSPELLKGLPDKNGPDGIDPHSAHMKNFVESVQGDATVNAPLEVGHASAVLCHIANAAIRRYPEHGDEVLKWDAEAERFTNSDGANDMLARPRRAPWDDLA
ncbi:Gfo/Idh/MocA family protein [Stratiformator vulcanicus]|uniref:Glucose--fructose oxidoreductase n=1 Tax=Stratiformator vulcanicus TaxID=2527980 RepID=A0A517R4L7_9PLAN|nr:Gfo/Idh/MocA family oxidoreductase [Stratiformator vulcanicus]QDT38828.1 Glucose--fructose oxidoreductase precursor [Stratiformator vulcanicus]